MTRGVAVSEEAVVVASAAVSVEHVVLAEADSVGARDTVSAASVAGASERVLDEARVVLEGAALPVGARGEVQGDWAAAGWAARGLVAAGKAAKGSADCAGARVVED